MILVMNIKLYNTLITCSFYILFEGVHIFYLKLTLVFVKKLAETEFHKLGEILF